MFRASLFIAAVLLAFAGQATAGMIDTTAQWNGTDDIGDLGRLANNIATMGQTFTASASQGLSLDSFSFWLEGIDGTSDTHFAAYLMAWDGSKATGPVLYASAAQPLSRDTLQFTEYKFDIGGFSLDDGSQYVAFLSVSNFFGGNTEDYMGFIDGSSLYTGGIFVYQGSGADSSRWTSAPWESSSLGYDAAFQASFSSAVTAVPAPASLTLLGLGVAGVAGYGWRRRR
jgi:hypothetical protein